MDINRYRYRPEFRIIVTIDGQPTNRVALSPVGISDHTFQAYRVITKKSDGSIGVFAEQRNNGGGFVPSVDLTSTESFLFKLSCDDIAGSLNFFAQGDTRYGQRIFYANNLNAAGAIDATVVAETMRLTPAANVSQSDQASITAGIFSTTITPAAFSDIQAGKIRAGGPVSFSNSQPVQATASSAGMDLTLSPHGSYVIRLNGGGPVLERLILDPFLTKQGTHGIIEIFRDAWLLLPQPRTYTINFTTV